MTFDVSSPPVPNAPPTVNSSRFIGNGSFSYASGLADGSYNASVLDTFALTASWIWNINNASPPPATFDLLAGTWNFGLSDLSSFSLTLAGGDPIAASFLLAPKTPTSSIGGLTLVPLSIALDSTQDQNLSFIVGTGDRPARFAGDLSNVQFSESVPEPAVWALMLVGFGAVAGSMRRRPQVAVSYA